MVGATGGQLQGEENDEMRLVEGKREVARCTVCGSCGVSGKRERRRDEKREVGRRRATERQLDVGEGSSREGAGERDEWWGCGRGANAGERRKRWSQAILVVSSSLDQCREQTYRQFGDARWGYSYNQPSRGIVVMVTTTTTTRSGLGGVFKDIFAFAASRLFSSPLLSSPPPLHPVLPSLSVSPSSLFFSFSARFCFASPFFLLCFSLFLEIVFRHEIFERRKMFCDKIEGKERDVSSNRNL